MKDAYKLLPELREIEDEITRLGDSARVSVLTQVAVHKKGIDTVPLYCIDLGTQSETAPALIIVGGVHGLERIGTHVVLSFLKTVSALIKWDQVIQQALQSIRLVFIPLLNPGGMLLETRSNPRGVDLMRNAPVEADGDTRYKLYSGHRFSARLPWYRGLPNGQMEAESQSVCECIKALYKNRKLVISLDVHSGFGMVDRLWFPYAKTKKPFPNLPHVYRLKKMLDTAYPNHIYHMEPQSNQYVTHGDLWDYLYDLHRSESPQNMYLPLSLELGSWLWVKKNPRQMLSMLGVFNPLEAHRYQRILRRHLHLMDFLLRAAISPNPWLQGTDEVNAADETKARELWYKS